LTAANASQGSLVRDDVSPDARVSRIRSIALQLSRRTTDASTNGVPNCLRNLQLVALKRLFPDHVRTADEQSIVMLDVERLKSETKLLGETKKKNACVSAEPERDFIFPTSCAWTDDPDASSPADLTEVWADGLRKLVGAVVIRRVPARRGCDLHAQALAEPACDLGGKGKAVLADEQAHWC
jgi:hypothetical protein